METINNYNIIEKIGEGGMSKVYLAEHKYLHKLNALKKLKLQDKTIIEKFIKEAQILYGLNHNYIVKVEDCFDYENNLYIVIEYVKGLSLDKYIKKDGRIDQRKALEIFKKILCGVEYAHNSNIIHRDIKPSNIMIDEDDNPKILDFGIAKIINTGLTTSSTTTLINIGSPAYMSPEQYKSETADLRTDIYSLGIVFYEMLTGVNPYLLEDATPVSLGYKIVHEPLPDPKTYFPEINKHFREVILKCTQKNPNDRYNNCKEIIEALDKILSGSINGDRTQNAPGIPINKVEVKRLKKKYVVSILIILVILIPFGILSKYMFFDITNTVADKWNYSILNKNLNFYKIQFNKNTGLMSYSGYNGGKDESGIWKTDNGFTWDEIYKANTSSKVEDIFFIDDKTGWSIEKINVPNYWGEQYNLLKTTSGGEEWETQLIVNNLEQKRPKPKRRDPKSGLIDLDAELPRLRNVAKNDLICLYFLDVENGYIGSCGFIYKTNNGGMNWSKIDINVLRNGNKINGLFFYNSNYGWGCSNEGNIVKTINGGESWQNVFTNFKDELYKIFFTNANTGWAVGFGGIIIKSTDSGNSWVKQQSDTQFRLRDILFINDNTGWIVGEMGTLLKTTNGGNKWEIENPTPGNLHSLYSIAKSNDNKLYITCDKGGILTLDLGKH
ncbi:MAG: protein kinase domain-containing protein [Ignavibacteria bacterium]